MSGGKLVDVSSLIDDNSNLVDVESLIDNTSKKKDGTSDTGNGSQAGASPSTKNDDLSTATFGLSDLPQMGAVGSQGQIIAPPQQAKIRHDKSVVTENELPTNVHPSVFQSSGTMPVGIQATQSENGQEVTQPKNANLYNTLQDNVPNNEPTYAIGGIKTSKESFINAIKDPNTLHLDNFETFNDPNSQTLLQNEKQKRVGEQIAMEVTSKQTGISVPALQATSNVLKTIGENVANVSKTAGVLGNTVLSGINETSLSGTETHDFDDPTKSIGYALGNYIQDKANDLPDLPQYKESFFVKTVPELGTNLALFALGGTETKMMTLPEKAIGLVDMASPTLAENLAGLSLKIDPFAVGLAGANGFGEQYTKAYEATKDPNIALKAGIGGAMANGIQGFAMGDFMASLNKATDGTFANVLAQTAKGGLEMATIQSLVQVGNNLTEQQTYNKNIDILQGVGAQAKAGLLLGGLMHGMGAMLHTKADVMPDGLDKDVIKAKADVLQSKAQDMAQKPIADINDVATSPRVAELLKKKAQLESDLVNTEGTANEALKKSLTETNAQLEQEQKQAVTNNIDLEANKKVITVKQLKIEQLDSAIEENLTEASKQALEADKLPLQQDIDNLKTQNDAIQEQSTTGEVSRTGETGENIPKSSERVGQSEQGQEIAKESEKIEPKENDTVTLPSQLKGGSDRVFVFKDGEWKQKVGNEYTTIADNLKQKINEEFKNQKTTTNEKENDSQRSNESVGKKPNGQETGQEIQGGDKEGQGNGQKGSEKIDESKTEVKGTEFDDHGEDTATKDKLVNGQGDTDLTPKGEQQAKATGEKWADDNVEKIVTSPVKRAMDSAKIATKAASEKLGREVPVEVNKNMATWNLGEIEGTPESDFDERHWIDNPNDKPAQGAETFNDFFDRAHKAWQEAKDMPKTTKGMVHSKVQRAFEAFNKADGDTAKAKEYYRESAKTPKRATAAKNSVTEMEMLEFGLDPNDKYSRKSLEDDKQQAADEIKSNPNAAYDIVERFKKDGQPLSRKDQIILNAKKQDLLNEKDELYEQSVKQGENGDNQTYIQQQIAKNQQNANEILNTLRNGGTKLGQALQYRQEIMGDDYSHEAQEKRLVALGGGKPLTEAEQAQLTQATKEYEEKERALRKALKAEQEKASELEKKNKELEAEKAAKKWQSKAREVKRTTDLAVIKAKRVEAFAEIDKILKEQRSRLSANPIPIELLPQIKTIAETYIKEGIIKLEDVVDKIHEDLKDKFDDLSKRNVRDAITGYGYEKPTKKRLLSDLAKITRDGKLLSQMEDIKSGVKVEPKESVKRTELQKERDRLLREQRLGDGADKEKKIQERVANISKQIEDIKKGVEQPKKERAQADERITELQKQKREAEREMSITQRENNKRLRDNYAKKAQQIKEKIAKGDYDPEPPRQKTPKETETFKAWQELQKSKNKIDALAEAKRQKELSNLKKSGITLVNFLRSDKLGIGTLIKIVGAFIHTTVAIPAEYAVGKALSKLPVIGNAFKNAGTQSDMPLKDFAQSYAKGWSKGVQAMADNFRYRQSELDKLAGEKHEIPTQYKDWFSMSNAIINYNLQTHKAIKSIPRQIQFEISLKNGLSQAAEQGLNVSDPQIMFKIHNQAIMDANQRILQGKNLVSEGFSDFVKNIDKKGYNVAAGLARIIVPFTKAPTNFVGQSLKYSGGGLVASAVRHVVSGGIEKLTPEERGIIARGYKMGGVGTAVALAGYFNYDNVGSITYKKDGDDDEPSEMSIRIGDVEIPEKLLHHPLIMSYFVGATIRKAQNKLSKENGTAGAITIGALVATSGIIAKDPYLSLGDRFQRTKRMIESEEPVTDKLLDAAIQEVEPKVVKELKEVYDTGDPYTIIKKPPKE